MPFSIETIKRHIERVLLESDANEATLSSALLSRLKAVELAEFYGIHCMYSRPDDIFVFRFAPFGKIDKYHEVLC